LTGSKFLAKNKEEKRGENSTFDHSTQNLAAALLSICLSSCQVSHSKVNNKSIISQSRYGIRQGKQKIAIDFNLIPYYGELPSVSHTLKIRG
jgi:hypothetical protein